VMAGAGRKISLVTQKNSQRTAFFHDNQISFRIFSV